MNRHKLITAAFLTLTALMVSACDNQTFDQKLGANAAAYDCPEGTVAVRLQLAQPSGTGAFCMREAVLKPQRNRP